jgi:hypothetical protein
MKRRYYAPCSTNSSAALFIGVSNLILIEPSCFHLLKYMSLLTRPDPVNEAVDDFLKKAGAYRRRGSHLQNLRAVGF